MPSNEIDRTADVPADFSHWHRDHDLWERDASRWQAEHQQALVELERVAQLIVRHGVSVRRHAANLEDHKQALSALEESRQGSLASEAMLDGLTRTHRNYREVHDRIRQHHDNVMALLRAMLEALQAPM